jgi:Zn-dependent alcohol dehydrogenase
VGQSVIQGGWIAGASMIIAIDPFESRRQASLVVGATHAVDPAAGDPVEQVRALTAGRGADYTFEVVGVPELVVQAFDMARVEGAVIIVGLPASDATITLAAAPLMWSGKLLRGSVVGGSQILQDIRRSCAWPRQVSFASVPWSRTASPLTRSTRASTGSAGPRAYAPSSFDCAPDGCVLPACQRGDAP